MTYSRGAGMEIETTALATMALFKANSAPQSVKQAANLDFPPQIRSRSFRSRRGSAHPVRPIGLRLLMEARSQIDGGKSDGASRVGVFKNLGGDQPGHGRQNAKVVTAIYRMTLNHRIPSRARHVAQGVNIAAALRSLNAEGFPRHSIQPLQGSAQRDLFQTGNIEWEILGAIPAVGFLDLNQATARFYDNDLAIGTGLIGQAPAEEFQKAQSTASERHRAINWLVTGEDIYSETDTST